MRFQHGNHLGSVALELDEEAQIIGHEEFHPYGTTAHHLVNRAVRATAKRYRHTGMERDEESGLSYHTARYGVIGLARWASVDPGFLDGDPNSYAVARCQPTRLVDPEGRQARRSASEEGSPDMSALAPPTEEDIRAERAARAGSSGEYESFDVIETPYFEEGSVEARALVGRGAEFGIARRYSTDSDELIETVLMYRLPEQEDWVVYDPVAFDRGVGVSHDPWGQMVIDTLLTLGISAVARSVVAEAAELYALEEAGVTVMHSGPGALLAGVYRMVRGSGGGVTYVRLGARFGLASEGSFVARHASGLVSYIRTGVTGRIERVRATL
ncbi:MAG TPA: RHS repeat-associated core domain-containing protein, partial [Candidatus Eisenbacteria bacterium]|nr:RHS repeat-associated core domain-containing protein [Candidatus Eisenbacteria bacterium]